MMFRSPFQRYSLNFKNEKCKIRRGITVKWLKSDFFPSWTQLVLELSSFPCWSWWGHYRLNQQRKWNSFQCLCCFGCYPVEQEEHSIWFLTDKQRRKSLVNTLILKHSYLKTYTVRNSGFKHACVVEPKDN